MTAPPDHASNLLASLRAEVQTAGEAITRIGTVLAAIEPAVSGEFQGVFNGALKPPSTGLSRRVIRGKIESDPELEAFIRARIQTTTFPEIAADVAANFPPERRASMSSIHRWYHRQAGTIAGNRIILDTTVKSRETPPHTS